MGTLPDHLIRQQKSNGRLGIDPFKFSLVMSASYDLRMGSKILASPLGPDELGEPVTLTRKRPTYPIQTGQMVAVLSLEKLNLPLDLCASFGIRSEYSTHGIIPFGGLQIDPGFRGHVIMMLQNVGPEPVPLTLNKPLFSIEFRRLEKPAKKGYEGPSQDQDDFHPEQYKFILSAHTTSLAEIPTLRNQVARLTVRIEELFDKLPDPDEGLELKGIIHEQLIRSMKRPKRSLFSAEDMRERLGL